MLSRKMDLVEEQLAVQSRSFDELRRLASTNSDRIQHIPSIQPLRSESMKRMASGYGYRSDPVYGTSRFHEGLDFASHIGAPGMWSEPSVIRESLPAPISTTKFATRILLRIL